jgi:hypothetical protein
LGEEAGKRYCVGFWLEGDQKSDQRNGKWRFSYPAADGSEKHVVVRMDGRVWIEDWERNDYEMLYPNQGWGFHAVSDDLRVVKQRLEKLFAEESIDAKVLVRGKRLIARYNVRKYEIHPRNECQGPFLVEPGGPAPKRSASFATNLVECVGPRRDGFWLEIGYDTPAGASSGCSWDVPEYYWDLRHGAFPTATLPDGPPPSLSGPPPLQLVYQLRCGSGMKLELRHRIVMALVK